MKLYEISDGLFTSGYPGSNYDVLRIHSASIDTIVCLARRTPEEIIESVSAWYRFPVPDGKYVHPRVFVAVDAVRSLRAVGKKVLVHCNAGRNRSPLVAALVVLDDFNGNGAAVLEHVRRVRPNALANPAFADYLGGLK